MHAAKASTATWRPSPQQSVIFGVTSLLFFFGTGATFTSLGIVLPHMAAEFGWTGSEGGIGFSILALMVGLTSRIPGWTLKQWGVKQTFGLGGALMVVGFAVLATATGLYGYYLGAGFVGMGYTLSTVVPSVYLLNSWFPERRAGAIGAYFMLGGLGGAAGPSGAELMLELTGMWRVHWWGLMAVMVLLTVLAMVALAARREQAQPDATERSERLADELHLPEVENWHFRDAFRTPQYILIVAAMTMTLFCGVTMNTWAYTHMTNLGVAGAVAAGALSAHGIVNALARGIGGAMAKHVNVKWLLVSALVAEAIGMVALAYSDSMFAIVLFALGEGYGFGMCLFATTILLINYFGPRENPKLLGTLNLITTLAVIGPTVAGIVSDEFGSFAWVFIGFAVILLVLIVATALMKPPGPPPKNSEDEVAT